MSVETVVKELVVGKEASEVVDAVAALIEDIKAKKDIALIIAENLSSLANAVDGYDKISAEMKSGARNETAAYAGYKIAEALAPDTEV